MERRGSRLSRLAFVVGVGAAGLAAAGAAPLGSCGRLPGQGQPQLARVVRIGWLAAASPDSLLADEFLQGMRERGYVVGQNLVVEYRVTESSPQQLAEFAADLAGLPVDVIVTSDTPTTRAAKEAGSTIPVVFVNVADPVGVGLVASLARPGGNATGLSNLGVGLSAKRLELLKGTVPGVSRVAVFWNSANPGNALQWRELDEAAGVLGIKLQPLETRSPSDFDAAFEAAERERVDALYVAPEPLFTTARAPRLLDFAARHRLPSMYGFQQDVKAGALMACGPSHSALYQRAAYYVDRILKGAKPADLPVEQPMTFEFVVNMKTAQALGLTFPNEIMLQVTDVIQ
jgi:putative tryptophan/tyrosine transport system substrate-binding protein